MALYGKIINIRTNKQRYLESPTLALEQHQTIVNFLNSQGQISEATDEKSNKVFYITYKFVRDIVDDFEDESEHEQDTESLEGIYVISKNSSVVNKVAELIKRFIKFDDNRNFKQTWVNVKEISPREAITLHKKQPWTSYSYNE